MAVIHASTAPSLVVLAAVRALLRARTEEEVVGIVLDAVRDLGGSLERPRGTGDTQLPVDVTFGIGEPLVPAGDPGVLTTLREVLPELVADAYVALDRTRREGHLARTASTDALTGLANRRIMMRVLSRLAVGDAVVMADLDHFKAVNDTYGHQTGDEVLRSFARALRQAIRASDTAGRLGGEEFALVLPRTDAAGATAVLDRLRVLWEAARPQPVTFSAGVAVVTTADPRQALADADAALYEAKNAGRHRVVVAAGGSA